MNHFKAIIICNTAALLVCFWATQAPATPSTEAVSAWAASNFHPITSLESDSQLDDLMPLNGMIDEARLVLLGESRHDAREHFILKHRVIKYLVAEKGFTILAMEESLPCAGRLNDWLLGGPGDPEELLASMSAWFIWSTEEVLDLIKWLREWNDNPVNINKVRFYGLDIMDPLPAVALLTDYLKRVDPEAAALLVELPLEQFDKLAWPSTSRNYKTIADDQLTTINKIITDLHLRITSRRDEYINESTEREYEWYLRLALNLKQSNNFFTTSIQDDFLETGYIREEAMTGNALWLIDDYHEGEKAVIWAHNFHIGRDQFDLDIPYRPQTKGMIPMGNRLSKKLGDEMVAVGFSYARGSLRDEPLPEVNPDSVDGVLAACEIPLGYLDLRQASRGAVYDWLHGRQLMHGEGGIATLIPAKSFDVIIFTAELSKTRPTAGAVERFNLLR